ncbi:osteoclast-associated immunoglobulin-like receptor isoform X2 [Lepidochelys kempii]|uniref:osteoclast-associated immunoglobulin-like receptor isoform X2 n=1 Tax=Lepidochelys kempii TaxID=8472 RepID=UPI003C6F1D2F
MASALTVLFLSCWLAGHSGAWEGREYPKPTVWVSPSRVVAVGGSVTIRCEGSYLGLEFVLPKAGHPNPQVQTVPDGTVAEFPIPSVGREDGGSYTCEYHSITDENRWSYVSDPIEIIVGDPSLPRPSISLSPTGVTAPGADVTSRCRGQSRDVRFFLHKAGDLNPPRHMDPAGDGAEFRIPTVGRQHGGSYGCSYRPRSEPFVSSQPSHPVQLVVAGEGPGSTSPLPAGPSEGGTDPTQPGAVPDPTRLGSAGPGGSESPAPSGLTSPIIAGASAAATGLLLLLLLVAFLCFQKTQARKGTSARPSSTSPLRVLKAPAQQDPIYHPRSPCLHLLQLELIFLEHGRPELHTVFQIRSHQCPVERYKRFPLSMGTTSPDASCDCIRLFHSHITLASPSHPVINPPTLLLFCFQLVHPQLIAKILVVSG